MRFLKRFFGQFVGGLRWLNEAANPENEPPNETILSREAIERIIAERDLLFAENNRLRVALKCRNEMIDTLIDEYEQALAAEGKKEPASGPAETGI